MVEPRPHPSTRSPRRGLLIALATLVALGALWLYALDGPRSAFEQLPDSERRGLYERTLSNLKELCPPAAAKGELRDFCREQARLLADLPECDTTCRALATPFLPTPAR
jgi:hypothetical protein